MKAVGEAMKKLLLALLLLLALAGCKKKTEAETESTPPPAQTEAAPAPQEAATPPVVGADEKAGPLDPKAIKPHNSTYAHSGLPPEEIAKVALMHQARGEYQQALDVLAQGIAAHPESAALYAVRGALYLQLGQYSKAIADLSKSLELHENPDVLVNRALAYKAFGQKEDALKDLNRALELDPHHVAAWFNRGTLYLEEGKPELALPDLDRAVELAPDVAGPYFNRAVAKWQLGKKEEAIQDLEKFIELAQPSEWKETAKALLEEWKNAEN